MVLAFSQWLIPAVLLVGIVVVIVGFILIKCVADAEDNFRKD